MLENISRIVSPREQKALAQRWTTDYFGRKRDAWIESMPWTSENGMPLIVDGRVQASNWVRLDVEENGTGRIGVHLETGTDYGRPVYRERRIIGELRYSVAVVAEKAKVLAKKAKARIRSTVSMPDYMAY